MWYNVAMNFDTDVHILGLTPREQFLTRLVMSNLVAGFLDKTVQETSLYKTQEAVDQRAASVVEMFAKYNDFIDMLCPESMLGRARSKVLLLKPQLMRYVLLAFNGYDHKNNYLRPEHRQHLYTSFELLNKKIVESAQHLYNKVEIERARNS